MRRALRWGVGVSVLAWVVVESDWQSVVAALGKVSVSELAGWCALNALVLLLMAERWRVLLKGLHGPVPLSRLTLHRLAGFGVSFLTPGPQFGGEPLQVLLLIRREQVPAGAAVTSVALDRLLDFVASFVFLALGAFVVSERMWLDGPAWLRTAPVAPILGVSGYLVTLALGHRPLTSLLGNPRSGALERLRGVVADAERLASELFRRKPGVFGTAVAVSAMSWFLQVGAFWWLLGMLAPNVTLPSAVALLVLVRLAFLLPLPGGIGAVEAALVFGGPMLGMPEGVGFTAAAMIRGRDLALALSGIAWGLRSTDRKSRAGAPDRRARLGRSARVARRPTDGELSLLYATNPQAPRRPSIR